jgi:hypothetical protein
MNSVLLVVLIHGALFAQSAKELAVGVLIETYMKGHATGDPTIMRQAFRPTAQIEGIRERTKPGSSPRSCGRG